MFLLALRTILYYTILFPSLAFGQLIQQGYFEIDAPASQSKTDFTVIPAKANGIVLIGRNSRLTQTQKEWSIIMLDTGLHKNDIGTLRLGANYDLIGYETTADCVFFLFDIPEWTSGVFQLIQLKFADYSLERFEIQHASDLTLTHFSIAGNSALFGGKVAQKAVVLLYNMPEKKLIAVPGFFNKQHQLLDLRVNENNTFNSLTIEENVFRMQYIVTKVFSEQGRLLLKDSARVDEKIKILSGRVSGLERNDLMVAGTYTKQTSKRAIGFYAVPVDPLKSHPIQYYPFSLLEHFLDYMGPKRAANLKEKEQDRVEAGKATNYSAAYLQLNRLEENKAGFFLSAEMLNSTPVSDAQADSYSRYSTRNSLYTPSYGFPAYAGRYYNPSSVYRQRSGSEVEYMQSALALFNSKGELIWDATIDMKDIKYTQQRKISDFIIGKQCAWIVYKKDKKLFINMAYDSASKLDTLEIASSNAVLHEYADETGIQKWYDKYFVVWGYRDLKYTKDNERRNHVLYIAKLSTQ